jgi:hypothetical protein
VNWWDRDSAAGYSPFGGGEVMAFGDSAARGIEALVYGLYHRSALLEFDPVDVGIGWSTSDVPDVPFPLVVEFGSPKDEPIRSVGQTARNGSSSVVIWPLDGAVSLATHMGGEIPNPVPDKDVLELGVPASLSVERGDSITTKAFMMYEEPGDAVVPSVILDRSSDPQHALSADFVGLVPIEGLKINTTYRVEFRGSITSATEKASRDYSRTWHFSTGGWAYPPQK